MDSLNKEQLFRELYKSDVKRLNYFDTVPHDLRAVMLNQYTDHLFNDRDMLIKFAFGEHANSVEWFLNDWQPGFEVGIVNGEETIINNIDDMIDWMKKNEGFEQ